MKEGFRRRSVCKRPSTTYGPSKWSVRVVPAWCLLSAGLLLVLFRPPNESDTTTVGEDEEPFPLVVRPDFSRSEQARRNAEAH